MARGFWLANAVIFLDEVLYLALIPLLPYYAERFELSKTESGLLYAAYPLLVLLSSVPAGLISDRLGGRRMLLVGCGLLVLATVGFAYAQSAWQLWLARALQGLTAGLVATAGMAMIAASADPRRRATTIGAAVSLQGLSALGGYALGGFVAPALGVSHAFLIPAALGLITFGAVLLDRSVQPSAVSLPSYRAALLGPLRSTAVRASIACILTVGLAGAAAQTLASLSLDTAGYSTSELGVTFIIAASVGLASAPLAGRLADRKGVVSIIRAWAVATPLILVGLALAGGLSWAIASCLVAVLALVRVGGTLAYARGAEYAGLGEGLAASYGLAVMAWSVGAVAGPLIAGVIADATTDRLAYACVAAIAVVLAIPASRRDRCGAA